MIVAGEKLATLVRDFSNGASTLPGGSPALPSKAPVISPGGIHPSRKELDFHGWMLLSKVTVPSGAKSRMFWLGENSANFDLFLAELQELRTDFGILRERGAIAMPNKGEFPTRQEKRLG
jgi:hypothetical protein